MIGLDTNVLVRYLVNDDKRQAEQVSVWIRETKRRRESLVLNHIVLCELVWVLETGYGFPKSAIIETLERLLETKQFHLDRKEDVRAALEEYRQSRGDFSDYLLGHSNQTIGCQYTVTLDQELREANGFQLL